MLQHPAAALSVVPLPEFTSTGSPSAVRVGVGIDTSRYGHYAVFLREDLQPAAPELQFTESAAGYNQFRARLDAVVARYGQVHFVTRLDAAGQYADNLLHFLHQLGNVSADSSAAQVRLPKAAFTISCGDPQRNKNYRAAVFGSQKSDPVEARAAARYALSERPSHVPQLSLELRTLRQIATRLQALIRQRTRQINQLHHLLALAFPELALLTKDLAAGWVLELIHRYPTAQLLAAADHQQLADVPYLPHGRIAALLDQARSSIASLQNDSFAELIRDQVRQLRDVNARQKRLEKLLAEAYQALPQTNHLDTIPGIGAVTAAVLTAFILDIDRFRSPGKLVAYFGVLPIEVSSGVDREGRGRGPKRYVMSRRGNDLVRRYLWMAALSAVRFNPAVRALYRRVVTKHPDHKAIAVGHAMRKLLHLVFAVWKTKRPFDPRHYPWEAPLQNDHENLHPSPTPGLPENKQAAGHTPDRRPARKVVTAACSVGTVSLTHASPEDESLRIDFAHLKRQLPLARVLDQLGLSARLHGSGPQQRGACPLHRGDERGRTFSVHLDQNVFHCFDKTCGQKGDVIDLWAAVRGLSLRNAALDLVHTFGLEPAPLHPGPHTND